MQNVFILFAVKNEVMPLWKMNVAGENLIRQIKLVSTRQTVHIFSHM